MKTSTKPNIMTQTGMLALQTINRNERSNTSGSRQSSTTEAKPANERKTINIDIIKVIGQGSFGTVYQGRNDEGKIVAVKSVLQDPRYKNREYQIMKKMHHPCVIELKSCFSTHTDKKELYFNLVMDYFPHSLYTYLKTIYKVQKQLADTYIKLYFYQMLRSLLYVHSFGVVHRDIKPQNVLINPEINQTILCDFGSAKILIPGEPNIAYICSRYYRAPELIFGATQYTTAVDVWSMGCVFVELMIGRPLFPGETSSDQLIEIIKIIGTPTKDDIIHMNPDYNDFRLPEIKPVPWTGIIKRPLSSELLDLLKKLFIYIPAQRITPVDALVHPYFDELRSPDFSLPNDEPYPNLFDFTKEEILPNRSYLGKLVPPHARTTKNWPVEIYDK